MIKKFVRLMGDFIYGWPPVLATILMTCGYLIGLSPLFYLGLAVFVVYVGAVLVFACKVWKEALRVRSALHLQSVKLQDHHHLDYDTVYTSGGEVLVPKERR